MPSDLELLTIEIDTLWLRDERGRLLESQSGGRRNVPYFLAASAGDGWALAFGSDLADALVADIEALFADEPPATDPSRPPPPFDRCEELLTRAVGTVEPQSGPSYVIPPGTSFASDATILRSDEETPDGLRHQDFERINWTAEEWRQLLDAKLGPWAFVVDGARVVSMCHSARLVDVGAEAGAWTDPDYRGRGYAAATTAAWASLLAPSGRTLFYSTWAANVSSQRVAERLALPLIGWMWSLSSHEPL